MPPDTVPGSGGMQTAEAPSSLQQRLGHVWISQERNHPAAEPIRAPDPQDRLIRHRPTHPRRQDGQGSRTLPSSKCLNIAGSTQFGSAHLNRATGHCIDSPIPKCNCLDARGFDVNADCRGHSQASSCRAISSSVTSVSTRPRLRIALVT